MPQVMVIVLAIDQDAFPGYANFTITDVFGVTHSFSEKTSVIGIEIEKVPNSAWIDCAVLKETEKSVLVCTKKPYGVESDKGHCEFEVPIKSYRRNL